MVTAAWPAVAGVRAEFHPHWGGDLSWIGASAEAACALALRTRQAVAWYRERREREADAECRLGELEVQVHAYGDALAAMARYGHPVRPGPRQLHSVPTEGKRG